MDNLVSYVIFKLKHIDKALVGSLSKKLYQYCLVVVGSRNGFERDFTNEIK